MTEEEIYTNKKRPAPPTLVDRFVDDQIIFDWYVVPGFVLLLAMGLSALFAGALGYEFGKLHGRLQSLEEREVKR